MKCMAVMKQQCSKSHNQIWHCYQGASAPVACRKCEKERKEVEKHTQKAVEDQRRRDAKTQKHFREVAKIQEETDRIAQSMKDQRLDVEQGNILAQKRMDLAAAKKMASRPKQSFSTPSTHATGPAPNMTPTKHVPKNAPHQDPVGSPGSLKSTASSKDILQSHIQACLDHNVTLSKTEWQRQKDQENADNPAIDEIMEMIGLEDIKSQVLRIKSKVDTSKRQNTDLKKERLGLALLGNPGTGRSLLSVTIFRTIDNV